MVEADPNRFEAMAEAVARIPLDGSPKDDPVRTAAEAGLRPALSMADIQNPGALRVEVMDPHDLWDARDAGLRGAVERAAPAMIEAAAPAVAGAVLHRVTDRIPPVAPQRSADMTYAQAAPSARSTVRSTLQLGAFSSPAAARAAWNRISEAGAGVAALTPEFESVEVDGRTLTRLKVVTRTELAREVCRAADAADLGCLRRG